MLWGEEWVMRLFFTMSFLSSSNELRVREKLILLPTELIFG